MLENDLQAMFEWQASSDQPPAEISVPAARRRAQVHRRRRRVATIGSPMVAAAAAVAIGLSLSAVSGVAGTKPPSTAQHSELAPTQFNPLVPYATFGWMPVSQWGIAGDSYPTELDLAVIDTQGPASSPVRLYVYAARQCALTITRLTCGSEPNNTAVAASVSSQGPVINGHASYWVRVIRMEFCCVFDPRVLAFQYGRRGWALLEYPDQATAISIAQHVRFGQTAHVRFPVRLAHLPRQWNTIQMVSYTRTSGSLLSGDELMLDQLPAEVTPTGPYFVHALYVSPGVPGYPQDVCKRLGPTCQVIDGYRVTLSQLRSGNDLFAGDADGLWLNLMVNGPNPAPSAAEVFAHHLKLLGPDPANWTTTPISP
jgi:hypothetical protein